MTAPTIHEHSFPLGQPGLFGSEGPCETCGKTRERLLAEEALAEAVAAVNATVPEGSPNRVAAITGPMLAVAFCRLRVVTVAPDGMPLEYGPLAAAIISGIAGDMHAARLAVNAKGAIEEAARDLGFRPGVAASILAAFPPPVQGKEIPLAAIFDGTHPRFLECDGLRTMYAAHPAVKSVVDAAAGIEGRRESAS